MRQALKKYRLRARGAIHLMDYDPDATLIPGHEAKEKLVEVQEEIADLQNRLYAASSRSVLLVLQGMDTSGKDGATIATFRATHPQGIRVASFKAPTALESSHDFLWRVHQQTPARGMIGVFNRSHYEAVVAERVLGLAGPKEIKRRFGQIIDFERMLTEQGTVIVKCFLHISKEEQKRRLESRLTEPHKFWKFNPNDLIERGRWDQNLAAWTDALANTATEDAPWWIVPSNHKPHRNLMVASLVRDALKKLDPQYPPLDPSYRGTVVE